MVGIESAQQLYDHLTSKPDQQPSINRSTILKGRAGRAQEPGFSRTVHYEISGAARVDYQYNPRFAGGALGDVHKVVRIIAVTLTSH